MTDQNAVDMVKTQRLALDAFSRTLRRETHVLTRYPELLWQQLYNRLQWEGEEVNHVLSPELTKRSVPGVTAWMRTRKRIRESATLDRTFSGHTRLVFAFVISPDGSFVVSDYVEGNIKIWDVVTGLERATLTGQWSYINAFAISADSNVIVSANNDSTLIVWDAITGYKRTTLSGHTNMVTDCDISQDGSFIVSSSLDGTLKIWDTAAGQSRTTLKGHFGIVDACEISPDGNFIVSVGHDETIKLWDLATGQEYISLGSCDWRVKPVISPDGCYFTFRDPNGCVRVHDTVTGEDLVSLIGHDYEKGTLSHADWSKEETHIREIKCDKCIAISPNGSYIVTTHKDNTLRVWGSPVISEIKPMSLNKETILKGHSDTINSLAISPDGRSIVSASKDKTLKVWDVSTGQELATLIGHVKEVTCCAYSSSGNLIISASEDKTIKIWDAALREEHEIEWHDRQILECLFSQSGDFILTSDHMELFLWNLSTVNVEYSPQLIGGYGLALHPSLPVCACGSVTGNVFLIDLMQAYRYMLNLPRIPDYRVGEFETMTLEGHSKRINCCQFNYVGNIFITASEDKTLKIWDSESGRERGTLVGHSDSIVDCRISNDNSFIVTASKDKTLKIWDTSSGRERATLAGHAGKIVECRISKDSSFIVSANEDATLKIWDSATGQERATLSGHLGGVSACAISPDDRWIVSASRDKTLKIWDAATGQMQITLIGHSDFIKDCAISPDNNWIYSVSTDKTIKVWEAATGQEKASLPVFGVSSGIAVHPWLPIIGCGDSGGNLYIADLFGINFGPIIITAIDDGSGLSLSCPQCKQTYKIENDWLGEEINCPNPDCANQLRINSFVVKIKSLKKRWQFWKK